MALPPVYQLQVDLPDDSGTHPWTKPGKTTCLRSAQSPPSEVDRESVDNTDEASESWDSATPIEEVDLETRCYGKGLPSIEFENSDALADVLIEHATIGTEEDDPEPRFDDDGLPIIEDDNNDTLADVLRNHAVMGIEERRFWPIEFLYRIISRERLLAELKRDPYQSLRIEKHDVVVAILNGGYVRLFALLLLIDKGHEIDQFITQGLSDSILPVKRQPKCKASKIRFMANENGQDAGRPGELQLMYKWTPREKEDFEERQWSVIPARLRFPKHYKFEPKTILPWKVATQPGDSDEGLLGSQFERQGAYGTVTKVIIDPCSHDFCPKLKEIKLEECRAFAVKRLNQSNIEERGKFYNEKSQLRLFDGVAHRHLVTLLASFEHKDHYHLIFPWADYSLEAYWERERPEGKERIVLWVAKQMAGLMAAVDTIHNPPSHSLQPNSMEKKYGRHSDIKPDNILWFRTTDDQHGILVLADLGLSALNREVSRSNIPSEKAPRVPGYRPPECDIDGAMVSRAFDIWTLACLFTELLTWLLGGRELLDEFERVRKSQDYLEGVNSLLFFQLMEKEDRSGHVVQVKKSVSEWFVKLHGLKTCTQFIHDALDIIEDEMLVVISEERTRTRSTPLRRKFEKMYQKCVVDAAYETKGLARHHTLRQIIPVEAKVKKDALTLNGKLSSYRGAWSRSGLARS
ncbi:Cyclin-dependent kinase-like 4 [Madurella mycetomatis]|uniref:Cyclin-dependent kinase-like 4 n=1 Tax=Madurella mycetomatis TaxID=100816 RepID=A0A175WIA9_9PEZI|nr:Cyclin-dependent kinase-like 4 [Madurella mycetomatis]